ncbi:MAG TPA: hypothetical protein VIK73_05735 [Limnochordales bacterium]
MPGRLLAIVIVVAILLGAGSAIAADPSGAGQPDVAVSMEHLVISPGSGAPGMLEVLDVLRLHPASSQAGTIRFSVPLPQGYEGLRVLAGFREGTVQAGPDHVQGEVSWDAERTSEGGPSATVAVAYRVPLASLPHPWVLSRPFAIEAFFLMTHADLETAVAGAEGAGPVQLEGESYQGFVRQGLPAGEPVLLAVRMRQGSAGTSWPWWAWAGLAAGLAGLAGVVVWRWRAGSRLGTRRRTVEALLALDAEYAAGYLETERYQALRRQLMERLADEGRPASGGPAAAPSAPGGAERP